MFSVQQIHGNNFSDNQLGAESVQQQRQNNNDNNNTILLTIMIIIIHNYHHNNNIINNNKQLVISIINIDNNDYHNSCNHNQALDIDCSM